MVGAAGIEPATTGLEIRCSIHLSYAPTTTYEDPFAILPRECTGIDGGRLHFATTGHRRSSSRRLLFRGTIFATPLSRVASSASPILDPAHRKRDAPHVARSRCVQDPRLEFVTSSRWSIMRCRIDLRLSIPAGLHRLDAWLGLRPDVPDPLLRLLAQPRLAPK
jgi:hypothetical protein